MKRELYMVLSDFIFLDSRLRDCVAIAKSAIKVVMPVKTGIQELLNILDSPVSSTGQALRRALLAHPEGHKRNDSSRQAAGN